MTGILTYWALTDTINVKLHCSRFEKFLVVSLSQQLIKNGICAEDAWRLARGE